MTDYFDRPLRAGDRVGLIGPSGAIREAELHPAELARRVAALGFEPVLGDSVGAVYGYLSGDDALRAADIHRMFADATVRAVFCVRGGYGTPRLLDRLDWALLREHPKPLIGYSDITGLHLAIHARCGYPSLHALMPSSTKALADDYSRGALVRALTGSEPLGCLPVPADTAAPVCLQGGAAEGIMVGGNLSLIASLCGTPYMPDLQGKILFIEDIGEKVYAIDRMLTHLRLAGAFAACAAVVFGGFTDCAQDDAAFAFTLEEVIADVVAPAGKPILFGVQAGHLCPTHALPLGVRWRVDADAGTLTCLESMFCAHPPSTT